MKAYYLALFMLLISVTIGMVDDLGVFTPTTIVDNPNIRIEDIKDVNMNEEGIYEYNEDMSLMGTMKMMLSVFIPAILGAVWIAPILFTKLGVPLALVVVLQVGIYVVYFIALLQIIFRTGITHYE